MISQRRLRRRKQLPLLDISNRKIALLFPRMAICSKNMIILPMKRLHNAYTAYPLIITIIHPQGAAVLHGMFNLRVYILEVH